jgi:hypothetical protein
VRPRLLGALVVVAVAAGLLAFQPLRSPWWTGFDFDSAYAPTGLTLFRGDRSNFYDHPGAPLQEGLGLIFTGAWLAGGADHSRAVQSDAWVENLDSTRPYLRAFGAFMFVAAALLAYATVAWLSGSAFWGVLGALLALSAPDLITWAAVVKPDSLLVGLSFAAVGLIAEAFRRRSGPLYLAAAFVLGFDLSVKVQAAGVAVPFVLALALRPPPAGWWTRFAGDTRLWLRRHRRAVNALASAWALLLIVVNTFAAAPQPKPLAEAVAGTAVLAAASFVGWRILRGTRFAGLAATAIGAVFACVAGLVVPNLLYLSFPAPMLRQMAITLSGGGVNTGASPQLNPWDVLRPWHLFLLVAVVGLVRALSRRESDALVWASGALALGLLAYLRYGEYHYYAAAIAVAAPLVLRALRAVPIARPLVAVVVVAAVLYHPYRTEIDRARARGKIAARTERVNAWVAPRLAGNDVALTSLESSDSRHFYIVDFYSPWHTPKTYRFLPQSAEAIGYISNHRLRVAYIVASSPTDATAVLRSYGLPGSARRVAAAPGYVYRVSA